MTDLHRHHQALCCLLTEFDRVCSALQIPYFLFAGTLLGAVRHGGFIPWDDDLDVLMRREDYDRLLQEGPAVLNRERFFLQCEGDPHWPMFFSKLRLNGTTCLEKYHPRDPDTHLGIYMDIFPCDNCFDSSLGRKLQFYASKVVIAKGLYARGYETDSTSKKLFMQLCRLLPGGPFQQIVRGPRVSGRWLHSFLGAASKMERSIYPAECFSGSAPVTFEGQAYPGPADPDLLLTILYGDYMQLPPPEARKCKEHAVLVDPDTSWEHYRAQHAVMEFESHTRSIR